MSHGQEASAWTLTPQEALGVFDTTTDGLAEEEAEKRLKERGPNIINGKRQVRAHRIFLRQFASPLIFVLIAAAVLTTFLSEWVDTAVIVLAVLVNAFLGFYQEYRAENTIEKLSTYIKERARVVRGGTVEEVDSATLVPGDVIRLSYGSRVPADARIISENSLTIDEAILTGESLPVHKEIDSLAEGTEIGDRINMAHAGTLVVEGYGTAVVARTGTATELGRIAELVHGASHEKTPLQRSLGSLAWIIFVGVLAVVAIIFGLGISRGEPVLEMLLVAAAVAVGSIPEALPIALTVILAVGAERLARVRGVVRSLAAAETLSSASVVMTDKTGTLTKADMQLTAVQPLSRLLEGVEPEHTGALSPTARAILAHALFTTDVVVENPEEPKSAWRLIGRPMETGIVRGAREEAGIDFIDIMQARQPATLAFNSTNKFAVAGNATAHRLVAVGAPDVLLKRAKLSKEDFITALEWIDAVSAEGKRLLGVALLPESAGEHIEAEDVTELEFLGVLVFQDPLREETPEAVRRIEALGAKVIMVTGDLKGTAVAVAQELGWEVSDASILTGEEVRQMDDAALIQRLPNMKVFARMTPEDKLRVGKLYRGQGEVVAMTGDGVNDAPSLKAVDIGVALGSGSDVAKSAADLVLLDDNFATIVSAIEEGRRMLANIRKAFVYLMSTSLDEVILIGGALLAGLPLPLTALQIIWVNLFTEGVPALSFAFDEQHDKSARRSRGGIFNAEVKVLTIGIGAVSSVLLLALYWLLLQTSIHEDQARAILFLCFAFYILIAAYSFRSLTQPLFSFPTFSNRLLNVSVLVGSALLAATVFFAPLREVFDLAVPPVSLLWIVVVWLVGNIALIEAAKWGFRHFSTR